MELETFNQSALGQHLGWCADDFRKAYVACVGAYDVSAAGDPYQRFILIAFESSAGVDIEQLRMQRSLK